MNKLSKNQLIEEARKDISALIKASNIKENEAIQVLFRDAYIYLFNDGYYKGEIEYQFKYFKKINEKWFAYTKWGRSFCYNIPHSNSTFVDGFYYDRCFNVTYNKTKNYFVEFQDFENKYIPF